jgi:hypothetical protein
MCLRFVFLLITRVVGWLRLQRRQPCRPKLNWADRALIAALLGLIPKARRQGLKLLVTPDTIVRWQRDIIRRGTVALGGYVIMTP